VDKSFTERLWDAWCIVSIVGIWPRFIEPKLICTTHHTLPIPTLPKELDPFQLVQISDLHDSRYLSPQFLRRVASEIMAIKPDCIVFTGDLLSFATCTHKEYVVEFLSSLTAPFGCFAVLGNHDYTQYVSYGDDGASCVINDHTPVILRGLRRLVTRTKDTSLKKSHIDVPLEGNKDAISLLQKSGFCLLHNATMQIGKGLSYINITGLGDLMAGQCLPHKAFTYVDPRFPTVVLSHNPDSYPFLAPYPGDLFLFGHTHGGQVNIPGIWSRITPLKCREFKSGLHAQSGRFLYINRGLGQTFPFRWFAPPEITHFTLVKSGPEIVRPFEPLFQKQQERVATSDV